MWTNEYGTGVASTALKSAVRDKNSDKNMEPISANLVDNHANYDTLFSNQSRNNKTRARIWFRIIEEKE